MKKLSLILVVFFLFSSVSYCQETFYSPVTEMTIDEILNELMTLQLRSVALSEISYEKFLNLRMELQSLRGQLATSKELQEKLRTQLTELRKQTSILEIQAQKSQSQVTELIGLQESLLSDIRKQKTVNTVILIGSSVVIVTLATTLIYSLLGG